MALPLTNTRASSFCDIGRQDQDGRKGIRRTWEMGAGILPSGSSAGPGRQSRQTEGNFSLINLSFLSILMMPAIRQESGVASWVLKIASEGKRRVGVCDSEIGECAWEVEGKEGTCLMADARFDAWHRDIPRRFPEEENSNVVGRCRRAFSWRSC